MTTDLPAAIPQLSNYIHDRALILPDDLPIGDWIELGESLAFLDDWTPWAQGDWYEEGRNLYGAGVAVARYRQYVAEYPDSKLAHTSLKTLQNRASTCRAFPKLLDFPNSGRDYNFWHCDAVASLPPDARQFLLEAGKNEEMSPAQFRRFRDEEMHKWAKEAQTELAPGDLLDRAAELEATNGRLQADVDRARANGHDLYTAMEDYAAELAERDERIRKLQARIDAAPLPFVAPYPASYNGTAPDNSLADSVGTVYPRGDDDHEEWQTGRAVCQHCGRPLTCAKCGGVQG